VSQLGGKPTPAAGFEMGVERLLSLMENSATGLNDDLDVFMLIQGEQAQIQSLMLAERLRTECDDIKILVNCGGGSFKSQMKKADKSGAEVVLFVSEEDPDHVVVKYLRDEKEQQLVDHVAVINLLKK